MKLSSMLYKIHKLIESKELKSVSQKEMAKRLGVSSRTYTEWLRGTNEPIAMRALLDMLCLLNEDDLERSINTWRELRDK